MSLLDAEPTVVPPTLEGFISSHDLAGPISMVEALVTELLGDRTSVNRILMNHRGSTDYELILELRYPEGSVSRESLRAFMARYASEIPVAALQCTTIRWLPV
jgi:hypothetical protein